MNKATYDLLLEMFRFTKNFTKEYKYTVGESLKKETIEQSVKFQVFSIISIIIGIMFISTGLVSSLGQLDFASGHFILAYVLFISSFIFWITSLVKLSGAGSKLKQIIKKRLS